MRALSAPRTPTARARGAAPVVLVALASLGALGCGPPPARCVARAALAGAPEVIDVVEGGRGFVTLAGVAGDEGGAAVRVEGLAPGFSARVREDGVLVVGAPYGVTGTLPARLEAVCADGDRAQHAVLLAVKPLAAVPLSPAEALAAGPGVRTRPALAVVEAGVVVLGGFAGGGAAPGAPLDDVWLLPRATSTSGDPPGWRRVDADLGVVLEGAAGALQATAMADGRVLVLAPSGALAVLDVAQGVVTALAPGGDVPRESAGAGLVRAASTTFALCGASPVGAGSRHCRATALDDDGAWRLLAPDGFSPAGRAHPVVALDAEAGRVVLFGGDTDEGPATDAWRLDLDDAADGSISWAHLARARASANGAAGGSAEPAPRRGPCGAVDPLGHRLLVVGGAAPMGQGPSLLAWDLERTGELPEGERAWREVRVAGMPAAGEGCAAAWDPVAGRLVVGFGVPAPGEEPSLWALDASLPP